MDTSGLFGGAGCRMDQEFLAAVIRAAKALERIATVLEGEQETAQALREHGPI